MFQNLRPGNTIYILDKTDVPALKTGTVLNVGSPMAVYNTQTAGLTMGMQPKMELSVRAKVGEQEGDFAHLPCDQGVHDYGNMIVADSREAMLSEVDAMKQRAQEVLDSVDKNKATIAACEGMFKVLNPNFAKEAERDAEIKNLSGRLDGIEASLSQITKLLNKK